MPKKKYFLKGTDIELKVRRGGGVQKWDNETQILCFHDDRYNYYIPMSLVDVKDVPREEPQIVDGKIPTEMGKNGGVWQRQYPEPYPWSSTFHGERYDWKDLQSQDGPTKPMIVDPNFKDS